MNEVSIIINGTRYDAVEENIQSATVDVLFIAMKNVVGIV